MKFAKNKTMAILIALLLITSMFAIFVVLPTADAHDPPWTLTSWCYVAVSNDPIGVNQEMLIVYWDNVIPPGAAGMYGDRWTFTLEITRPDKTKETLGPFTSDPIGGGWTKYTPTQVGTYTVVSKVAEHKMTGYPTPGGLPPTNAFVNDTFLATTSDPMTWVVQQQPIQEWPETPLPTQFWTFPINNVNRRWVTLAGSWLAGAAQDNGPTNRFVYGSGPESAHVMWAVPMWAGGMMDARFGAVGYATEHYEGTRFLPPIILNGKLYYNVRSLPREGWYCLDLYTGQTEYFHNTTGPVTGVTQTSSGSIPGEQLDFGQILNVENPNQDGGMPYLWSMNSPGNPNTWMMFSAFNGQYMCSIGNVSSGGTAVYSNDGSILRYAISGTGANKRLTVWNTTHAIWWRGTQQQWVNRDYSAFTSNAYWMWRPGLNVTYDGNNGFSLNASIPDVQGTIRAVREDKYVIGGTPGKNNGTYVLKGNLWALNLKPAADGSISPTLLWNITFTPPLQTADDNSAAQQSAGTITMQQVDPEDGVFLFKEKATRQWWGYSLETGQQLWGPTEPEVQMNYYAAGAANIYQGKLLTVGYGGVLTAYDIKTGQVLWNYTAHQIGFESPYGNYPISTPVAIADGKIYVTSGDHSHQQPMWRGSYVRCINASNGAELWKMMSYSGEENTVECVLGYGYVVGLNQYTSQITCYGKGPSATTVEAPLTAITEGSSVVIRGTVIDISAGTKQKEPATNFPKGVPAMSDEDMQAWMEFVYLQQPMPKNAKGVEVTLDIIDPNGNFFPIGNTTSDISGMFSYMWTPEIPGKYTVIATFAGSKSYYGSYARTAIGVSEAPAVAETQQAIAQLPLDMYLLYATVAIIAAIAVVGAIIIMVLKKRP